LPASLSVGAARINERIAENRQSIPGAAVAAAPAIMNGLLRMDSDLLLGRKYTFRFGAHKQVFIKKPVESHRHVVMKALLWALYLPTYPDLRVEVPIGYKYKPDLVQLGFESPCFWAEAGRVGKQKLTRILKQFPATHFAFAIWGSSVTSMGTRIGRRIRGGHRQAPIDLIHFPEDANSRFIDQQGIIRICHDELEWKRLI
jgi:hypothetical protein